jgi:hypothetical protein
MIGAVSAVNETDVIAQEPNDDLASDFAGEVYQESSQPTLEEDTPDIETTITSNDANVMKGSNFTVQLKDSSDAPIANKEVKFTINHDSINRTTDENGIASLKIDLTQGRYTINYTFICDGYRTAENSTDILVITTSASKIKASAYTAYVGVENKYTVTLKVGDVPLADREIIFKINGKTISARTNEKGKASINIDEPKGSYTLSYFYAGEENINPTEGTVKITVKKGMPTKIAKANSVIYRNKKADYFKIKLLDARGNPIKSQKVTFKVKGKKYTRKTNSKGIASIKIKLKTGSYKVKVSFAKTSKYNKASKTYKIKVKPKQARNNGIWLLSSDMKKVNFDKLQSVGTKHIFLNAKCLERFGKKYVETWIKDAKSHGIKVHIWMQVFYNSKSGWISPVKKGKIKTDLIKSKVKEAKKYAKIKGVAGVHFDYVRFPGNAYQHKNGMKAVNLFVKKASKAIHKINRKLIVSAAVMPEPSSMKKYYGQDIPTMSKYLDVIVPMVYKGNYHAGREWIKQVTKTFSKQSKKAKIWTGLQTYKSDSKLTKLSAKELMGDADAAALGGAYGVILFRYGLINYINFNEV